jgi:hypothetical protein
MQKVMVVLWQTCGHVADFRPWALGVPRLAALRLMGAD